MSARINTLAYFTEKMFYDLSSLDISREFNILVKADW